MFQSHSNPVVPDQFPSYNRQPSHTSIYVSDYHNTILFCLTFLSNHFHVSCIKVQESLSHSSLDMTRYLVQFVLIGKLACSKHCSLYKHCIVIIFGLGIYASPSSSFFPPHIFLSRPKGKPPKTQ